MLIMEISDSIREKAHLQQDRSKANNLVHLGQFLLRLISHLGKMLEIFLNSFEQVRNHKFYIGVIPHRRVYCALQQFRQRLHVHSEIQLPPSSEKIQVTLAVITSFINA